MPILDEATAVYRYYSKDGALLYVGMSRDPDERESMHRRLAADTWYPLAAKRSDVWYPDRISAEKAELQAITAELPLFNVQENWYVGADGWEVAFDERKRRMRALMQGSSQPLYRTLMAYLRAEIGRGALPPGSKLAPLRVYASELGVSTETVKRALSELAYEGTLRRVHCSGYYVAKTSATGLARAS